MATITQTSTVITINGAYKDFTGGSGSTTTVIQYSSGDAPVSGDAGRFLMWKVTAGQTGTWQIRYIESATSTTVTVGDGGFSSAPPSGAIFAISTNLDDVVAAVNGAVKYRTSYRFVNREWNLENGAFLADVNKSLEMTANSTAGFQPHYLVATGCAVQFGRLLGGEANDSFETTEGCRLGMEATGDSMALLGNYGSFVADGPIFNLYGCQVETYGTDMFLRGGGPVRFIGCLFDGVMGGRWLSSKTEIVQTRFSGNLNGQVAWSLGATFTRPISEAVFYDNVFVCKGFQNFSGEFRNSTFTDTNTQIIDSSGASSNLVFDFIDCTTFSDTKINDPKGTFNQAKSINYTLTDISGTGLDDVKVAVYDNAQTIQTGLQTSVSGVINQINAVFFCRPHNLPTVNKAPFDIRIRKYGYVYQGFQSAVSDPILQEVRLPVNNELASTEAQAAAITGISINFATETITITQDHNAQSLYDYYQYQLYQDANMAYGEDLIKTGDAFNIDNYDLIVDNAVYTGDITTTGSITFQNGAQGVGVFTSSGGTQTSISLTFNNLSTSTVEIFDNTGSSVQRYTNQTGTLVYITPLGSTGTWSYIIDRIGYRPILASFDPTLNNLIIDGTQQLLLTAQGNPMYSGSSSALVNITYDFVTPQLNIEIGDGGVSPQVIFDEVEQSLVTANGMRWQKENNTLVTFDDLPAVGQMLFMQDNIRLKRASAGDVNAAVNGYVLSTQGTPVDGVNGNVNYIASPDYATPVWDALLSSHNVSSSFGALLQLLETKAQADARQAILVSEHNDTQADIAALNDFNPATDTVANVTLVATTTTNTDMRGTDGANTIAPDNAGITQIQTDISNLNDITAAEVYTEFTSGTNEDVFKADVSALATQSSVDTIDANVDSILVDTSTTIPAQISALNDLSEAQVKAQADQALIDYDPPTKAELDTAVDDIIAEIIPASDIADAVWDEPYNQHTTAGTFGKLMDILRKANRAIEGEVTGTPTTTSFTTNISGYVTGAFDSEVMVFVSGTINGEARPILNYNATNGTFNFEEAWTQAPSANDEFIILPYHVHAISEIQAGLAKTTELNTVETNLLTQHTATQNLINALNDITAAEVYTEFTSGTNEDAFKADVSGLATQSSVDTIDSVVDGIAVQTTRVDGLIENSSGDRFTAKALETAPTDEISETEFHDALDSYQNKNSYKANVSALATEANATTNTNSIIAEVNANEAKIDLLETKAEADTRQTALIAEHDQTQVDVAAVETAVLAAIGGLNDLDQQAVAQAVWDYLQSETTVSGSLKEAVEQTLINARLIPAAL